MGLSRIAAVLKNRAVIIYQVPSIVSLFVLFELNLKINLFKTTELKGHPVDPART